MIKNVEEYFINGCGRCDFFATPKCKVRPWNKELLALREMIQTTGLEETVKWGVPCYTADKKNILILSALKEYCSISFFKGVLISDTKNLLVKPGENSQSAMLLKFTALQDIQDKRDDILSYIQQAIEIEKQGKKVTFQKNPEPIPEELTKKFKANPELKKSFEALTPGRQRGYILYFSQPKQSKTREQRIEKCIPNILAGRGFYDR